MANITLWYDIRSYGADPTASALTNRTAILDAISAANSAGGGTVYIPDKEFIITKTTGIAVFVLSGINNVQFVGEGVKSKLTLEAGSYAGDTHFFSFTSSSNVSFKNIQFYGNRGNHSVDNEQMHGVRMFDSSYFRFENCYFNQLRGDGLFLLGNTLNSKIWIDKNQFYQCGRSGITIQRLNRFLSITNNYFEDINDQAIDSEPTGGVGYDETNITNNFFYWATPRSIGVTLGGSGSQGINFVNNQIIGAGLFSTSLSNSKISYNVIQNTLALLETADNVTVSHNDITSTGKCINIYYQNEQPQNFLISYNRCVTSSTSENIITVQIDGVTLEGNKCIASDSAGTTGTGIIVSAPTVSGSQYKELYILNNKIFNTNVGITVSASSSKTWKSAHIIGNTIKDLRSSKTITTGINLSGPAYYHFEELFIDKNAFDTTLSETNQILLNASGCSWYKISNREFNGIIAPESNISAQYNTTYNYIGLPYKYTKTVDGGSTGWVEKNIQLQNVLVDDTLLENPAASVSSHTPSPTNLLSGSWTNQVGVHNCLTTSELSAITLVSARAICTFTSGLSSCIIQSVCRTGVAGSEYSGIVFRYSDSDNYWSFEISAGLDTIRLVKREGGSDTVMTSGSVSIPSSGYQVLRVKINGDVVSASYNGGTVLTSYSSFNNTSTAHGFISRVATRYYFDDFKISGI